MNYLGIDYGSRRVGIAVGNDQARLAEALIVLPNDDNLTQQLAELVRREQAEQLIVGLPRSLEGEETAQTRTVRQFGAALAKALGLPVNYQDEAVTSRLAAERLGRSKPPVAIDSLAAAIILQDYLDQL